MPTFGVPSGAVPLAQSGSGQDPAPLGTTAVGTQAAAARADHVHPLPTTSTTSPAFAIFPSSGAYFPPALMRQSGVDVTPAAGTLNAQAVVLGKAITLTELWAHIGTAGDAGSLFRLGVYSNVAADFYPNALLLDAGTIAADVTGRAGKTGLSLSLAVGIYWLVGASQNWTTVAPALKNSVRGVNYHMMMGDPAGNPGFIFGGTDNELTTDGFSMTGATGALPGTFSATRTRITAAVPLVVGRAA